MVDKQAEKAKAASQAQARAKMAAKTASQVQSRAKMIAGPTLPPTTGIVGFDSSLHWKVAEDINIFARDPADPLLGGTVNAPSSFNASFVHALGRVSNMCYSVAAFVKDPVRNGVRFARHKMPRTVAKERVWVPPPQHAKGGPHAPDPGTLLDCVSTDMWPDPSRAPCPNALTVEALHRAIDAKKPKVHALAHPSCRGLCIGDREVQLAHTLFCALCSLGPR